MTSRFVLEGIDPNTNCIALELTFEADEARLASLIDIEAKGLQRGASWPIEPEHLELFSAELGISFEAGSLDVWLRAWRPTDSLPYKIHTNRELRLMLEGRKPLAVFDVEPETDGEEEFFGTYVAAGKFIRREHSYRDGRHQVLYALPGEEWRIDAYIEMSERAQESGWSEELERRQGHLLGYEDWQNDTYIETIYRPAIHRDSG